MLPQVATHILHHSSRAAAAVHNQTSQALRNAWQFQQATPATSSGGSGGGITNWSSFNSSSGWGGSGTGAGGAKYSAGNRCYSGYTGPGRSVTQANQTSTQPDDNDEASIYSVRILPVSVPARQRPRSSSLSLSSQGRIDRGERLGVLKAVQIRARHAFATKQVIADVVADDSPVSPDAHLRPIVRRNSTTTSSLVSPDINVDLPPPPPPAPSLVSSAQSPHDSDLKSENEVPDLQSEIAVGESSMATNGSVSDEDAIFKADKEAYDRLYLVAASQNYDEVVSEVQRYRSRSHVSVACYNMALHALQSCRNVGQPITFLLELYNEMLSRSLLPNIRTYLILIGVCCTRDIECQRVISTLENRISRRTFTMGDDLAVNFTDESRVARLRAENNFASALTLFQAATSSKYAYLGLAIYNTLLRSCAYHGNVEAAIRVFAHMERFPEKKPSPATFGHLINAYGNVNDIEGAREVFNEFKEASRRNHIQWDWVDRVAEIDFVKDPKEVHEESGRPKLSRSAQIVPWNQMINAYFKCGEPAAALGLLETMLDTPSGELFTESDAPLPNSVTYTSIIVGFCNAGDWRSALNWFDRLLRQEGAARNTHEPLSSPPRPGQLAWIAIIDTLARVGAIEDLNRLFRRCLELQEEDNLHIRTVDRHSVFRANVLAMRSPDFDPARAGEIVDFIVNKVIAVDNAATSLALTTTAARTMLLEVSELLMERHQAERALDIVEKYVENEIKIVREAEEAKMVNPGQVVYHNKGLRNMVLNACNIIFIGRVDQPIRPVEFAMRVAALCDKVHLKPQAAVAPWYIHSYATSKKQGEHYELSQDEWVLLLDAFLSVETPLMEGGDIKTSAEKVPPPPGYEYPGLRNLLLDMKDATNIEIWKIVTVVRNKIMKALIHTHGSEEAFRIVKDLGEKFSSLALPGWGSSTRGPGCQLGESIIQPEFDEKSKRIHIDLHHSRFVDEWYPTHPSVSPLAAFDRFSAGAERGVYPSPETLGRLIAGLGRIHAVDKVRTLYDAAQVVLGALENQKRWQSAGWFVVEDQMIIAFAHAGEFEAANVHRKRITDQGGTPSADAYGALISAVKDTTDDATAALEIWEETRSRGVRGNTYIYNTIISKLSKARKADHALAIFRQMQSEGIKPSSITFGALISACCRVGDALSAEHLFHEMTSAYNFKPRVPPYNTMIQFYTLTKPNRERVLYYYNAMLATNVNPTAHTYKLLLEAYGTIQPIDLASMEAIFQRITEQRDIEINGTHWAALINAYGCAAKDLDRAVNTFESIASHPSASRSTIPLPDAIAYEALFAVFSHHRRIDLLRTYVQRLRDSEVHPTAYVVNAVIKGYAAAGDLDTARSIFESLEDPPMGVAAPHNHARHENENQGISVSPQAPVFREPSTWETMIRAELGVGQRDRALELIKRMESRGYPPAVLLRVRDIMYTEGSSESFTQSSSLGSISPT